MVTGRSTSGGRLGLLILAITVSFSRAPAASPNLPLDRPYTLRNAAPFLLEAEHHRLISGDKPMTFMFPRACERDFDSTRVCPEPPGWRYRDSARGRDLAFSPLVGYEYRGGRGAAQAVDMGVLTSGRSGPLAFYLDARLFSELHDDFRHASYDREIVDRQDEAASGSVAYSSYSRYRAHLAYDLPWGRLTAGRDAVHWGPGLFHALVFHQDAVPFNQVAWLSHLGPVSIITLYGQLGIHGDSLGTINYGHDTRSLYAHRYEWRAGSRVLLGISEQLVTYDREEPFAFLPVAPLFIFKGNGIERDNNGNIAFDVTYRIPGLGSLYSEFFVDDLQSPGTLFDDFWANKWAWMAGTHWVRQVARAQAGAALEYARIEPWVYTHYTPGTAQSANQGHPLGDPMGPNAQSLAGKSYLRSDSWYASLKLELLWKGADAGSQVNDSVTRAIEDAPKEFIRGVGSPDIRFSPYAWFIWGRAAIEGEATLGRNWSARLRMQVRY